MPELPDVEGFRRFLERHVSGQRVKRVDVPDTELVRNRSARSSAFTSSTVAPVRFFDPGNTLRFSISVGRITCSAGEFPIRTS